MGMRTIQTARNHSDAQRFSDLPPALKLGHDPDAFALE